MTLIGNEELRTIKLDFTRQDHQSIPFRSPTWSFLQIPQLIKEPEDPAPVSVPSLSAIFDEQGQRQKQQTVTPYPSEQTDIQSAPKSPISGSGPQPLSADDIVIVYAIVTSPLRCILISSFQQGRGSNWSGQEFGRRLVCLVVPNADVEPVHQESPRTGRCHCWI